MRFLKKKLASSSKCSINLINMALTDTFCQPRLTLLISDLACLQCIPGAMCTPWKFQCL